MTYPVFLPELMLKSTALLLLAGAVSWTLRKRSAALRHAVWAAAMVGLLTLPVLQVAGPGFRVSGLSGLTAALSLGNGGTQEAHRRGGPVPEPRPSLKPSALDQVTSASTVARRPLEPPERARGKWYLVVLATAWLAGALVILGQLLRQACRLRKVVSRGQHVQDPKWQRELIGCARSVGLASPPQLVLSDEVALPIAWGIRPGTVALPMESGGWSASRRRAVLLHELAHLQRRDWLTGWVAELARALYWPHPLAWWALARLRAEAERSCDDLVLKGGIGRSSYARDLLDLSARARLQALGGAVLPLACRTGLATRVTAILDGRIRREALESRVLAVVGILGLVVVVGVACARLGSSDAGVSPVEELVSRLGDPRPQVRQRAAWALGELEDRRAVQALALRLSDPDPRIRGVIAWALGEIKDRAAVAPLIDALDDSDPLVRETIVKALGELEDPRAGGALAQLVKDSRLSPALRSAAVWALGEIAMGEAQEVVERALGDVAPSVRVAAVEAFHCELDLEEVEALEHAVADDDSRVRRAVARRLGESGTTAAIDPLLTLLRDPLAAIRAEAATALGQIGDPRAVDDLIVCLRDSNPGVRSAATWALDEIDS